MLPCRARPARRLRARPARRSIDDVDPGVEDIPRAALGADVARFRRIALELAPQPQNLRIDRTVVDVVAVQARHVEKLIARQHAIGRSAQNDEQTELAVAEPYHLAGRRFQAPRVEVQLPAVESIGANALGASLLHL